MTSGCVYPLPGNIVLEDDFSLLRGDGQFLFASDGRRFFDLINGFGAVFLGHCDRAIGKAAHAQLDRLWTSARLPSADADRALGALASTLDPRLSQLFVYSTGMESIEFALRLAASRTGNSRFIGFGHSMHGKSIASANLGWENCAVQADRFMRLPFPGADNRSQVEDSLRRYLAAEDVAAVMVEPIQGSWQGDSIELDFLQLTQELCHRHGAVLVIDETLTGLYRTGPRFFSDGLPQPPEVLVFAKSLGNGFPVSVAATSVPEQYTAAALPGSTFSGNQLACSIVAETLKQINLRVSPAQIDAIGEVVIAALGDTNGRLSGRGALWILSLDSVEKAARMQQAAFDNDIIVARVGSNLRLLPQAEVDLEQLHRACRLLAGVQ